MNKLYLATALGVAAIAAAPASAGTIFGVDELNNLVTFNSANPGTFLSETAITGTAATFLAIDFRPRSGQLYGLGDDLRLYTINTATAVATAINATPLALAGSNFGFDFNPTIDRIRIVANTGQNYVINPITGTIQLVATPVAYGVGDPTAGGFAPSVTANAYTPSVFGAPGTTTQLYAIDNANDVLARQNNNAGTLTTVGGLGVNFGPRDSFDIDSLGNAFIIDNTRFYSLNLATGQVNLLGNTGRTVYGIAAAIPEPATWAMMIAGFGLVGGAARRRRTLTAVTA